MFKLSGPSSTQVLFIIFGQLVFNLFKFTGVRLNPFKPPMSANGRRFELLAAVFRELSRPVVELLASGGVFELLAPRRLSCSLLKLNLNY